LGCHFMGISQYLMLRIISSWCFGDFDDHLCEIICFGEWWHFDMFEEVPQISSNWGFIIVSEDCILYKESVEFLESRVDYKGGICFVIDVGTEE